MQKSVWKIDTLHSVITFIIVEALPSLLAKLFSYKNYFPVKKAVPKVDVKKEEQKLLPTDTNNGTHNRFGFKLRKTEATNIVLKKQPALSR